MALDDFAPASKRDSGVMPGAANPEDDDLFNFPVVELKADVAKPAKTVHSDTPLASTSAPLPSKTAATPKPTTLGHNVESSPPAGHHEPNPTAPKPIAPTAQKPARVEAHAPAFSRTPTVASVPRHEAPNERAEVQTTEAPAKRAFSTGRMSFPWIAALFVLSLNSVGFFLLWNSNRSFHSAVDGLRDDLALTSHEMSVARASAPTEQATLAAGSQSEPRTTEKAVAPRIASFEETAVDLARREIELGQYAAARMRLHRLIAVADRIDPSRRVDIEARASFLVGESYAVEMDRRLEVSR